MPPLPPEGLGGPEDLNKSGRVIMVPSEADSGAWPEQLLLHYDEHSEEFLSDRDLVKLVNGNYAASAHQDLLALMLVHELR